MYWGLKGGISIDVYSVPPRYVLWCCGSIFHEVFISIQIGREHTVIEVTVNICTGGICLSGSGNPQKNLLGGMRSRINPPFTTYLCNWWKLVCVFFEECHRRLRRVNKPFPIVHLVHVRQTQARNPEPWQSMYWGWMLGVF